MMNSMGKSLSIVIMLIRPHHAHHPVEQLCVEEQALGDHELHLAGSLKLQTVAYHHVGGLREGERCAR